jgi:hypothetical protein
MRPNSSAKKSEKSAASPGAEAAPGKLEAGIPVGRRAKFLARLVAAPQLVVGARFSGSESTALASLSSFMRASASASLETSG